MIKGYILVTNNLIFVTKLTGPELWPKSFRIFYLKPILYENFKRKTLVALLAVNRSFRFSQM